MSNHSHQQELEEFALLQNQIIDLTQENQTAVEHSITNFLQNPKSNLEFFSHALIVAAIYRPYSNDIRARLLTDSINKLDKTAPFSQILLTSLLNTILQRSQNPSRGGILSFLMYLVDTKFFSIHSIIDTIKKYKKSFFDEICFNVFAWLAPEIEKADVNFFEECLQLCENMKQNLDSYYPTVQRFLYDLPALRENDWQNLKARRYATIKIYSSIFKHNDIQNLVQLSFHPQFNPSQKVAQSIYEPSFVVFNSPSLVEFAAFCGAVDCFDFLIENGADPTSTDLNGKTLEEFAICGGCEEIINELEENEFDCKPFNHLRARFYHSIQTYDEKVMLSASYSHNLTAILKCFESNPKLDVDYCESNNKTALIIAAQYGHLYLVSFLLSKGANVNKQDSDGMTALQHACQNGYVDIVKTLLSIDSIDINLKHKFDMTAFLWSCQKGFADIVDLLLKTEKIDINRQDDEKWTGLHWAVQNRHDDVMQILLNTHGIDVNIHQKDELTALHFAATTGNLNALKALLSFPGIDLNVVDNEGLTPLHWACQNGNNDIVNYLSNIDHRCDVNRIDHEGWTPLHWAAQNNHEESIQHLLQNDQIDVNVRDKNGMTPFLLAVLNEAFDAAQKLLISDRTDINAKDNNGLTALHIAARSGNLELARNILNDKRAEKNPKKNDGITPLHLAVLNKQIDMVKYLLSIDGIDKSVQDDDGTTPEMAASVLGLTEIEKLFI